MHTGYLPLLRNFKTKCRGDDWIVGRKVVQLLASNSYKLD